MSGSDSEISPQRYYQLLRDIAFNGEGFGKTADVAAYRLHGIKICTTTSGGTIETEREIKLEPVHLCFDPKMHPTVMGREAIMQKLAILWAAKIVGKRELSSSEVEGPGVWVSENSKFFSDYIVKPPFTNDFGEKVVDSYSPNPDAVRLATLMTEDTTLAAPWGSQQFIAKGGSLATRELDLPPLLGALGKIARGEARPEDVLYKMTEKGDRVAAFDVYPMEGPTARNPRGFLLANYNQKLLREATKLARSEALIAERDVPERPEPLAPMPLSPSPRE